MRGALGVLKVWSFQQVDPRKLLGLRRVRS